MKFFKVTGLIVLIFIFMVLALVYVLRTSNNVWVSALTAVCISLASISGTLLNIGSFTQKQREAYPILRRLDGQKPRLLAFFLVMTILAISLPISSLIVWWWFEMPKLDYQQELDAEQYVPGTKIDTLTWRADWGEYSLLVRNTSKRSGIINLLIHFSIPGGFVQYKSHCNAGCNGDINLRAETFSFNHIVRQANDTGNITNLYSKDKIVPYSNSLIISLPELMPEGSFEVDMILKITPDWPAGPGLFWIKYAYITASGNKELHSVAYQVCLKDKYTRSLKIGDNVPFTGDEPQRSYAAVFEEPVFIGDIEMSELLLSPSPKTVSPICGNGS